MQEYLEITTYIGCPINCIEYCPQELIIKKHAGMPRMTLEMFQQLIETIPPHVIIDFSGLSECFHNPETIAMIFHAYNKGHPIRLSSTLSGLRMEEARQLSTVKFIDMVLHLPDAKRRAKIPVTQEYKDVVFYFLEHVDSVSRIMNMSGKMVSCDAEKMARGQITKSKRGRVICPHLEVPGYQLLPNGDVYFCCYMRGLTGRIGNLYKESYRGLVGKFLGISESLQTDPQSICHQCPEAVNYHLRNAGLVKDKIVEKMISWIS